MVGKNPVLGQLKGVSCITDSRMSPEEEVELLGRAREERLTGARLLDSPVEDLVGSLGYGACLSYFRYAHVAGGGGGAARLGVA